MISRGSIVVIHVFVIMTLSMSMVLSLPSLK